MPMIRSSKRHLEDASESYFEHMRVAFSIALGLARASLACTIHAMIPGLCTRSASRQVASIHSRLAARTVALVAETPPRSEID
jgi:hypothetical protein